MRAKVDFSKLSNRLDLSSHKYQSDTGTSKLRESQENENINLSLVCPFFIDRKLSTIVSATLSPPGLLSSRFSSPLNESKYFLVIGTMYGYCFQTGWVSETISGRITSNRSRNRTLSNDLCARTARPVCSEEMD